METMDRWIDAYYELGEGVRPGPTKKWDCSTKGFRGVHISCRGADALYHWVLIKPLMYL